MARHDDLLEEGAREAPEPETAEQRSRRLGLKSAGGGIVAGGAVAAKAGAIGGIGKVFLWIVAWHLAVNGWRIGGWIGIALTVAVVAGFFLARARRRSAA